MTRTRSRAGILRLFGGVLVVLGGCGKPSAEMALVLVDIQTDVSLPKLARLRFSVPDRPTLPMRTVDNPPQTFQFGYYLPGVIGNVTVKGQGFSGDGCVVAEGSKDVTGVSVGTATNGGPLVLSGLAQPICDVDAGSDAAKDAPGDGNGIDATGGGSGEGGSSGSGGMGAGGIGGTGATGTGGEGGGGTGTGGVGSGGVGTGGAGGGGGRPGTSGGAGGGGRPGTGGIVASGGKTGTGGTSTGGTSTGGTSTGGASTGGASTGGASTGGAATGGMAAGGMGTAGSSTGGMGSGGMGTGGAIPTVAQLFPAGADGPLDGRLVTTPCADVNASGTDCDVTGAYYRGTMIACPAATGLNVLHTYPVGGASGKTYGVTMHFYGILGPYDYGTGAVREAGPGRPGNQDTGAVPTPWATAAAGHVFPSSDYGTQEIHVDDQNNQEVAVYFLNADTSTGHWTFVINYQKRINVIGGGRVRVRSYDRSCRQLKNCGPNGTPADQCSTISNARIINVSGANPAPANTDATSGGLVQPNLISTRDASAAGQWLLIDVVSVDSVM